jgi:nucleotide-binding universal stress UspA family protein
MSAYRKILVPTDYSPHAREAFRVAHDLARPTGASVVMFHVSPFPGLASRSNRRSAAPDCGETKDLRDERRNVPAMVPTVRVEHETVVADRPDAKHILRVLKDRGCDLIVMGTRVRKGRKHRLVGSLTEEVVRRARCPVIVVTAPSLDSGESAHHTALQPVMRAIS